MTAQQIQISSPLPLREGVGGGVTSYRPDIDGLRAVAILLVVLYHLKIPGFSGGFVGVDIFFAISGFLIFSILNREYETSGRVDWLAFYARRIRRLLPEATIMIVTVMVLGFFVLLPLGEQQSLAKSGIAGSLWLANIYFWHFGGDYFAQATERQPLLHLWSLGVEEQFYLTVPVMFLFAGILCRRLGLTWRRSVLILLGACGLLSLGIAIWGANAHPTAVFFLLPARAYEFAIGALAALGLDQSRRATVNPINVRAVTVTLLGVMGIVLSVALASKQESPGAWVLLSTISTALLLWSGGLAGHNPLHSLLNIRSVVYLGKVSYGWYLWHFPLLVLWREYWLFDNSTWSEVAVGCVAVVPAAIGHYLVGRLRKATIKVISASAGIQEPPRWPFQSARAGQGDTHIVAHARFRRSPIFGYGALAVVTTVLVSVGIGAHADYLGSTSPEIGSLSVMINDYHQPELGCLFPDPNDPDLLPECLFGDPGGDVSIVLWGDSHANHWVPALDSIFKELGIRGIERSRPGCPPTSRYYAQFHSVEFQRCAEFGERTLQDLAKRSRSGAVGIILSARWSKYLGNEAIAIDERGQKNPFGETGVTAMENNLQDITARLAKLEIPVGIMLQVPEHKFSVPICIHRLEIEKCEATWAEEQAYLSVPKLMFSRIFTSSSVPILDPASFMCRGKVCVVKNNEILLYSDEDHLSKTGAKIFSAELLPFAKEMKGLALLQ